MVREPAPVTSPFQLKGQTGSGSLPCPPDAATTHGKEQVGKAQANAVIGLLKVAKDSSSPSQFELSSDSCCFSNSTLTGERSESFSSSSEASLEASVEAVIRGLRSSDRLFCEPAGTSSLVEAETEAEEEEAAAVGRRRAPLLFEGSVAVAVDSVDPYWDFRASMEEMVAAHGDADDWGWLEGMLEWYLAANAEGSHGIIVEAFVDLLLTLASHPSPFASVSATHSCPSVTCKADEQITGNNKKTTARKKH